jgi:hypothetical protein
MLPFPFSEGKRKLVNHFVDLCTCCALQVRILDEFYKEP